MKWLKSLLKSLTRPFLLVSLLVYFILVIGIKVVIGIELLNIFTLLLIPLIGIAIYVFINLNKDSVPRQEPVEKRIERQYFNRIFINHRNLLLKLFEIKNEIHNVDLKIPDSHAKSDLLMELSAFDLDTLLIQYAENAVRIKIIDDFLVKKGKEYKSNDASIKKLVETKERYISLNDDILHTFETIQAQSILLITDDVSKDLNSNIALGDIKKQISNLDEQNKEINDIYLAISK